MLKRSVPCVHPILVSVSGGTIKYWLLGLFSASMLFAQISPGPLSRAHAALDGATQCANCHNFGAGQRSLKCLECHVEIGKRVDTKQGYHAIAYRASAAQTDCARCHQEHNGRQFQVTRFDKKSFDHRALAGFALEGKHAQLSCEQCHTAAKVSSAARAEIKVKDLNRSFLGLGKECSSCHKDPHAAQLGANCVRCHSQAAWKPAEEFDHRRTQFPLTGLHQNVTCAKCHTAAPSEAAAKYKGLAFARCENCHSDPHRGAFPESKFANTCQQCHSTVGWKANAPSNQFNHQSTDFPLHGRHAEITCAQCHKDSDFKRPIAHKLCGGCHEDVHKSQFATRAAGADCSSCHNEVKFSPALFTKETHQQSRFKLEGKHAALECKACHLPEGKEAVYTLNKQVCADCHANPHGQEFSSAPYSNKCEQCHTQERFSPNTYSPSRHSQTKFTLTGAHAAVLCSDCHKELPVQTVMAKSLATKNTSVKARNYHFTDQTCTGCHTDPHTTKLACETCHNNRQWREVKAFDHAATKFSLEGAHQSVSCAGCHKPVAISRAAKTTIDLARTPQQCAECHEDIHGGQFISQGAEKDCTSCHTVTRWNDGKFDHNQTKFSLEGAHAKVRCAQCHTKEVEKEGKTIRVYRPTQNRCVDCHSDRK